ncbi:Sodium:neurotransmitter symporter family [Popillia japonica]|uniref:Sodium-dependent nutrient amino acid transporter 1 n=1 Tax=Popillia japonica TaxID=7064 RepID=A0AAW1L6Z9_POPJA
MGSLISMEGNVYTVICETFPHLKGWKVSLMIVLVGFLASLVYITPGGQYILNLVDHYGASMTCFIANIVVVCIISWFYGFRPFLDDIGYMLKRQHGIYWRLSWSFITPIVLVTILLYFLITMSNLQHEGKAYPNIALVFGWLVTGFAVVQIPIWMIVTYMQNRKAGIKQIIQQSFEFANWRPANLEDFHGWKAMKEEKTLELNQKRFKEKLQYAITGKF